LHYEQILAPFASVFQGEGLRIRGRETSNASPVPSEPEIEKPINVWLFEKD